MALGERPVANVQFPGGIGKSLIPRVWLQLRGTDRDAAEIAEEAKVMRPCHQGIAHHLADEPVRSVENVPFPHANQWIGRERMLRCLFPNVACGSRKVAI